MLRPPIRPQKPWRTYHMYLQRQRMRAGRGFPAVCRRNLLPVSLLYPEKESPMQVSPHRGVCTSGFGWESPTRGHMPPHREMSSLYTGFSQGTGPPLFFHCQTRCCAASVPDRSCRRLWCMERRCRVHILPYPNDTISCQT